MKISLIVAMASNRVIGLNNQMPWHLSADLKKFKSITIGKPIVMGRKTFESIGRPLPSRTNIIISRNPDYSQAGCIVVNDLDSALASACQQADEIFVIGGSALYDALLPRADRLYLTQINAAFEGDTFFPEINQDEWQELNREDIDNDPQVAFSYSFLQLERIA
ncbi:MAG: type 3 dihydrofolate reductase [Methylococcaceae bacterium]|nr:type 3 dihydrofolate reductase [Methylococcaceae bacterium]